MKNISIGIVLFGVLFSAGGAFGQPQAGSIVAWGWNGRKLCNVPAPNNGFVEIAGGSSHSLGLKADGSIVAWGDNKYGQCNVPSPNTGFIAVAVGDVHSLGLKADGSIRAWGDNGWGQCNVPSPNRDFVGLAGARDFSMALKSDGRVVVWGVNTDGQRSVPAPNPGLYYVNIAAGNDHCLALQSDGSIKAWGNNSSQQCTVPSPNTGFVAIAAGYRSSLALRADGSIAAWGYRYCCPVPSPNSGFISISAHSNNGLGMKQDGSIVVWGDNSYGQCTLPIPNRGYTVISMGLAHGIAISVLDEDQDGIVDQLDNCLNAYNPDQMDRDQDKIGDICDPDIDGDGILNEVDNCPRVKNADQADMDLDGVGDVCDEDADGDGVLNADDNCPLNFNPDQMDTDGDKIGDVCDNCPQISSPDQADTDKDGIGDVCDEDADGDGVLNADDNCPLNFNPDQMDMDRDGTGDVCDPNPDGTYSGGNGTPENPFWISSKGDLMELAASPGDYDKCFILKADIDLAGQTFRAAVIAPNSFFSANPFVGTKFTGVFDGNGHAIRNLTLYDEMPGMDIPNYYCGLFGYVSSSRAEIKNLRLIGVSMSSMKFIAGALVAYNEGGRIDSCHVSGSVNGIDTVGGLVGVNQNGMIHGCTASGEVVGLGGIAGTTDTLGGLVGHNEGTIDSCSATVSMTGYGINGLVGYRMGGLVGYNKGTILSSSATDSVKGHHQIGGLVGVNDYGTIHLCSAEGTVVGHESAGDLVGGLVGANTHGSITFCNAAATVSGYENIGGLAGSNSGNIASCSSRGPVDGGVTGNNVGGLVGTSEGTIDSCSAAGSVSGRNQIGGLVGTSKGTIDSCSAMNSVSGFMSIGGLVGENNRGTIRHCWAEGLVDGYWITGGLVGSNSGGVYTSFWDIETSGQQSSDGGIGKTTAEMKTLSTFTAAGWDFVGESTNGIADTWRLCVDGSDYPKLNWQSSQFGDNACPDGIGFDDLLYLSGYWLMQTNNPYDNADLNGDQQINLLDFEKIASKWLFPIQRYIPKGTVSVDGDLHEWSAGVVWIPLDKIYWGVPRDISNAKFALQWNPQTHKIYAAIVVEDTNHVFSDSYRSWDASDRIEIYCQGDAAGGIGWYGIYDEAQEYYVAPNSQGGGWCSWALDLPVGSDTGLEYAIYVSGDVIIYEVGVTAFDYYGGLTSGESVISQLQVGDIVGFDLTAMTRDSQDGFGMLSENLVREKYRNADSFAHYILVDSVSKGP